MGQVGTRAQSERIRTYNFTQDRVTDHRIAYEVRDIKVILLTRPYVPWLHWKYSQGLERWLID